MIKSSFKILYSNILHFSLKERKPTYNGDTEDKYSVDQEPGQPKQDFISKIRYNLIINKY